MEKKTYVINFEPETIGEEYAILIGSIEALNALMEINEQRFGNNVKYPANVIRGLLGIKKVKKGET